MTAVSTFDFDPAKSGKITLEGLSSYIPSTGAFSCETGETVSSDTEWNAYFSYDTSSLPDDAVTFLREWIVASRGVGPLGEPEFYVLKFSIGTFIGAALTGDAATWNAGDLIITRTERPADYEVIDLDEEFLCGDDYINKTGDTDLKIWDDSTKGSSSWNEWGVLFNNKRLCQLRITWGYQRATVTGKGSVSATAAVSRPGSATVTGSGTVTASGVVSRAGSATVTGKGLLGPIGSQVSKPGVATITGRGAVSASGGVTRYGAATVTGIGLVKATGIIDGPTTTEGYASVTGRGTATATGSVRSSWSVELLQETIEATLKEYTGSGFSLSEIDEDHVYGMVTQEEAFRSGLPFISATAHQHDALVLANGRFRKKVSVEIVAVTGAITDTPETAYKEARSLLDRLNSILLEEHRTWSDIVLEAIPMPSSPPRGVAFGNEIAALASVARADYYLRLF